KKIVWILFIPLFLFSCSDDDKDYTEHFYWAMQGQWLISTTSFELNNCTYTTQKIIEFEEEGTAYIRELRIRKCPDETAQTTVLSENKYRYTIDNEDRYVYLHGIYKYKVNKVTDQIMNVSVFNWTGEGAGWNEEWTRL
ncbi:MAG: hypothetical protein LIO93_05255, partial [Bacteroidales bacterium]|nr:hypothetical protein [Bacteroidales bacterium]